MTVLRHVAASVHKEAESLKASRIRNLVKLVKQEDNGTGEAFRNQLWDSDFEVYMHSMFEEICSFRLCIFVNC